MYERLTEFHGGIWGMSVHATKEGYDRYSVFSRLAAYENSELSPEEVQELAKVKAEGRLVVLPCKAGDAVYVLTADSLNGIEETSINRIVIKKNRIALNANCKHDDWGRAAWDFRPSDFGKTVFLTKEAAEKALGGSDGSSKD